MAKQLNEQQLMERIPKKYREHVVEVSCESYEGYWVYCDDTKIFEATGCQTAHGYSLKEIMSEVRTMVDKK